MACVVLLWLVYYVVATVSTYILSLWPLADLPMHQYVFQVTRGSVLHSSFGVFICVCFSPSLAVGCDGTEVRHPMYR